MNFSHHTPKVLLIESDPFLARIYKLRLRQEGWRVEIAWHGTEALDKARDGQPDLIVLDILMTGQDGLHILGSLRSHPRLNATPVIVATRSARAMHQQISAALGIEAYLIKTAISLEEVVGEARKVLKSRK